MASPSAHAILPALTALRTAGPDRDLARLLFGWFTINAGKWAFLVTNLVIAYEQGGPPALGLLGLARYLTPTLLAPFAGLPASRWRPEHVLLATSMVRATAVGLAAATVAFGGPIWLLYAIVALEAGAGAFTRPLHYALLPYLASSPRQLVAANVTSSAAEGIGTFVGPASAGLLLLVSGPIGADLAVMAIYVAGIAAIANLRVPAVGRTVRTVAAVRTQLAAGMRTVVELPGPRLVFIGFGLQTFVRGLLTVLIVAAAIELLGMGDPGVGALNAALGIGGIVGAALAVALVGRARLAPAFDMALAGWGAPILVIGLIAHPVVAIVAMVAIGTSNALLDVAGFTLAQRTTPNDRRVAVLGLLDFAANAGAALGGIVAPALIVWLGLQGAIVAAGLILPIAAVASWPTLRRLDEGATDSSRQAQLVRAVPLFAPLSLATVEYLAGSLQPVAFAAGASIMEEGEVGDRFVIIDAGEAEVLQGGRRLRTLEAGDGVGEIALLRDIPRTASVRAIADVRGWALDREAFLEAVTGNAVSLGTASNLVDERLAAPVPRPTDEAG